jgi:DNA repair protein RadC
MAKIKDLPGFARPREKLFEKGPDALKDYELLAILLRTGYKGKSAIEVAKRILETTKLENLSKLSLSEMSKLKGVGKSRASTISASIELSNRIFEKDERITIKTPVDVMRAVSFLVNKKKEYFVALYLNSQMELINQEIISVGIIDSSLVHPRELYEPAIKYLASYIFLVHNHPSGNTEPSKEDINITENLVRSGLTLDIPVIDHIIVSRDNYFSFKEKGMING